MKTFAYYSSMEQSLRKFRQASHTLSFLSMKTDIPFNRLKNLSLKNAIKLAKKNGFNYDINWREYPCQWHKRLNYRLDTCLCEQPCGENK